MNLKWKFEFWEFLIGRQYFFSLTQIGLVDRFFNKSFFKETKAEKLKLWIRRFKIQNGKFGCMLIFTASYPYMLPYFFELKNVNPDRMKFGYWHNSVYLYWFFRNKGLVRKIIWLDLKRLTFSILSFRTRNGYIF